MADPATVAGLGLAVAPLIISALENYEYTFQPIIIFSRRYKSEVERFQHALKVQKVDFANECCWLLHSVTSNRGNVMINNPHHALWQDEDLDNRLRNRLAECYDACVSALSLINAVLSDISKETKTLDILTQQKTGRIDVEWLRRLRQRSKISFSRDRYDNKLKELERRIDSLHKIRKHIEDVESAIRKHVEHVENSTCVPKPTSELMNYFQTVQSASSRLHEVLESHWKCGSSEVHLANICLDCPEGVPQNVRFDLAWSCPGPERVQNQVADHITLSIEACLEARRDPIDNSQPSKQRKTLQSSLEEAMTHASISATGAHSPSHMVNFVPSQTLAGSNQPFGAAPSTLTDLYTIPDLCRHLTRQLMVSSKPHCIGYLQKTKTFTHVLYTPQDRFSPQTSTKTLEMALQAAKDDPEGIPLPEKLGLARLLASAVLRFRSTPWLKPQWQSQDVLFLNVQDFSLDPLRKPFLRSSVLTHQTPTQGECALGGRTVVQGKKPMRSHIRNQTLYNLGVMLIELAYDSPFKDLQVPDDDQGDAFTCHWATERLGESVRRVLGQKYAEAVKFCLHCGFGLSDDLDRPELQNEYFTKVVQKLEICAEAVAI